MNQETLARATFTTMCIALLLVLLTVFYKKTGSYTTNKSKQFIVGTASGYAPFVSVDEKGKYVGFDIEMSNAIAAELKKELVLKDLGSMTSLFLALEQGSIDAIIWGLSITEERLKKVSMIRYFGETVTAYSLLFWKRIPQGIKSINDMQGKTVSIEPGSSQEAVLDQYPFIVKKPTEKVDDALLNIRYGKCDAALVEPAIAKKFKKKFPELVIMRVPLSKKDHVHGIGIVVKKTNTSLAAELTNVVKKLKEQGTIDQYAKQYGIE